MALITAVVLCSWGETPEKADALVGRSVSVQNIYRSSDGITIKKLQSDREVAAASKALQNALSKYPASFITRVLKTVYIGSEVTRVESGEKKDWGGFYHPGDLSIFMRFTGDTKQFEQVFHHELAHGIHCAFPASFDEKVWLSANPPEFTYTGVVDSRPSSWPELLNDGFVRPYAMRNLREDVACLAENMIGDTENFAKMAASHARIKRKASVLIALYQAVDPVMTGQYFRLQDRTDGTDIGEKVSDERGRPLVVSSLAARGAFLGNFRAGDRVTLLYREKRKPASRSEIVFASKSPANIELCRRKKARDESELTVLAQVPSLTQETPFCYSFKEDCAAVLRMSGEAPEGVDRVKFEFQIDRGGRSGGAGG